MVTGLGFRLSGLRFGLRDLGFKTVGPWGRVWGLEIRVQGLEFIFWV